MKTDQLKPVIEAILMVSDQPLMLDQIAELFDDYERPSKSLLRDVLQQLSADYLGRGIELIEVASGWRIQARKEHANRIARLWTERPQKYSRALLETLALIAYRQPVTRGDIEEIRGVSVSSSIMKTLLEREWVRIVGYRDAPGRPAMYATTRHFLDYFNLKTLDELPTLNVIRELGDKMQEEQQQAIADEEAQMLAAQEEKRRQMMEEAQAEMEAQGVVAEYDDDEADDTQDVDLDDLPEVLTFSELSQRFDERLSQRALQESQTGMSDNNMPGEPTYSEGAVTETTPHDKTEQVVSADESPLIPDSE
ncbi:SMC-Scp complex subunit ScpB [Oceanospirillum linum]|uniref:SMC-Scp complex subunit ScpB n=1 Tax=Oceanospirillum linum TaxID=966 RepID=A0A1T1HFE4_OCELI|nr:SMC-Scp complex subunit ScpB [Oceanospirillum linum]OOV88525.1 SMC-Scp complex subunit ScpB [Oceanospirillum linum]SEF59485.1 condensin subunit ScpB [Oleiphilus messinensis]SMP06686.1 condensin subunit ScpB [Oceanospirillum linum]